MNFGEWETALNENGPLKEAYRNVEDVFSCFEFRARPVLGRILIRSPHPPPGSPVFFSGRFALFSMVPLMRSPSHTHLSGGQSRLITYAVHGSKLLPVHGCCQLSISIHTFTTRRPSITLLPSIVPIDGNGHSPKLL